MNHPWPELITLLNQVSPDLDHVQQASHELQTQLLDDHQVPLGNLLEHLSEQQGPSSRQQEIVWEYLLTVLVQHLSQSHVWQAGYLDPVLQLYQLLGSKSNTRHQLLHLCTQVGDSACLTAVADQLSTDPPLSSTTVGVIFAPLFQDRDLPYDDLFPRLLDTLQHPSVAAATLDLTNYLVRKERFAQHPASDRLDSLQLLMRDLNQRLQHLVEQPTTRQDNLQQLSHTISESVALVIAGCNTLALIGQSSSIAVLRQTMELPHRRLQVEAAAALAKLGEAAGIETFYHSKNKQSLKLAHMVQSAALYKTRAGNRGVKKANFLVLSKNSRPAVLLECAFLSNSSDRYRALDPEYRQRIAEAVAMGIIKFRQSK